MCKTGERVIYFQDTSSKARGAYIRVINGPFSLGWIAIPTNGTATYRYFEPESNDATPIFTEADLNALKARISAKFQ